MRLWMAVCETLLQYVISRLLIYNAKILHGGQLHGEPKKTDKTVKIVVGVATCPGQLQYV